MDNMKEVSDILFDMEKLAVSLNIDPFEIYFLGGTACILGEYTHRATMDFDFIDLHYPAKLGRVLRYLSDFDMLEYESTLLSPMYPTRAIRLKQFTYLNIYILSKEDIVVSKVIRMADKDIEDMNEMITHCNKDTILKIVDEILERDDLFDSKKEQFIRNLIIFKEKYHV